MPSNNNLCCLSTAEGHRLLFIHNRKCDLLRAEADEPEAIPVIVLSRLAVDMQWQGCGIGFGLLKDAVARSLYVERTDDFFVRYGFTELTLNPMVLTFPRAEGGKKLLLRNDTEKIFTTVSQK